VACRRGRRVTDETDPAQGQEHDAALGLGRCSSFATEFSSTGEWVERDRQARPYSLTVKTTSAVPEEISNLVECGQLGGVHVEVHSSMIEPTPLFRLKPVWIKSLLDPAEWNR
jgi:hypothetical protein